MGSYFDFVIIQNCFRYTKLNPSCLVYRLKRVTQRLLVFSASNKLDDFESILSPLTTRQILQVVLIYLYDYIEIEPGQNRRTRSQYYSV